MYYIGAVVLTGGLKSRVVYQDILRLLEDGPKTKNQIYKELCEKKKVRISRSTVWRLLRELKDKEEIKEEIFGRSHVVSLNKKFTIDYENLHTLLTFVIKFWAAVLRAWPDSRIINIVIEEYNNHTSNLKEIKWPELNLLIYHREVSSLAEKFDEKFRRVLKGLKAFTCDFCNSEFKVRDRPYVICRKCFKKLNTSKKI